MPKNWNDGDLVGSAELDELGNSGIMRFANAAARNAFLVGDMAPKDGQTVFIQDTNATLTYVTAGTFSGWVPPPGTFVFNAYASVTQSIPNGAYTGVTWNSTPAYRSDCITFTSGQSKIYTRLPGWYGVSTILPYGTGTAGRRISILNVKTGVNHNGSRIEAFPNSGSVTTLTMPTVFVLNDVPDTHYIELSTYQDSGAAINTVASVPQAASIAIFWAGFYSNY
jgi:hypothetical protein